MELKPPAEAIIANIIEPPISPPQVEAAVPEGEFMKEEEQVAKKRKIFEEDDGEMNFDMPRYVVVGWLIFVVDLSL